MLRPRTLRRRSGVACRSTVWRARSCASLLGGNDFGVAAHEITGRVPEEVSHATGTSNGLPHAGSGRPVLIHSCQLVDHADGPRNDSAESRKSHRAATFDFSWRPCSTLLAGKRNATRSSLWHYTPVATSHRRFRAIAPIRRGSGGCSVHRRFVGLSTAVDLGFEEVRHGVAEVEAVTVALDTDRAVHLCMVPHSG